MHPCRMEQIDSVKINPSLVMMREWALDISELPKCSKDVLHENVAEHRLGELLRRHS